MFVATERWIDLATDATRETMRDARCVRNSCVEAACIAVGVAQEFGYLCEPVPVAVRVVSATRKEMIVLPGADSRRRDRGRPVFAGHLVVSYPGAGTVVDLTADQFHAPERGIWVPEHLVLPVEREDLVAGFAVELPGGTAIEYREMEGDVSWRSLPAWRESSALLVAVAVRRLRASLAAAR